MRGDASLLRVCRILCLSRVSFVYATLQRAALQLSAKVQNSVAASEQVRRRRARRAGRTVQLQAHAVVDFVVLQRDVVLEHVVPETQTERQSRHIWLSEAPGPDATATRRSKAHTTSGCESSRAGCLRGAGSGQVVSTPRLEHSSSCATARHTCVRGHQLLQVAYCVVLTAASDAAARQRFKDVNRSNAHAWSQATRRTCTSRESSCPARRSAHAGDG